MKTIKLLKQRRSYYEINKDLPVEEKVVFDFIKEATELVPDAFNMKSSRVIVAVGEKHEQLWDNIYNVFGGEVPREKIDSFKNAYGTILCFYDQEVVDTLRSKFVLYADRFEDWAIQSSGMLQLSIWTGLRELNIGASLQHYNPVIDDMVREMFDIPKSWVLNAKIPFGGIVAEPQAKDKEDISQRVRIKRG